MNSSILDIFVDNLKKQGFTVILLLGAIWYFHNLNAKMDAKVDDCNQEIITIYREDHVAMREVIKTNTEVMREIKRIVK